MACTLTRTLRLSVRLASHIPPPRICEGSGRNLFIAMTQKTGCVFREENLVTVSPCGFPLNCSSLFRGRGRRASPSLVSMLYKLATDMTYTLTRTLRLSVRLASHIPPPRICEGSGRNLFIAMTQKTGCVFREENLVTVSPCGFPLNCEPYAHRRCAHALTR